MSFFSTWNGGGGKASRKNQNKAKPKPFTVIPADKADEAAGAQQQRTSRAKRSQHTKYAASSAIETNGVHPDGPYLHATETGGKYQNYATCMHMLTRLVRMSPGVHTVDWQLSLRGNDHANKNHGWRRHFSKPAQTFDALQASRKDEVYREKYEKLPGTPDFRCPDDRLGKFVVRDDQPNWKRAKGCEGAQSGQWLHLLKDNERGTKNRSQIHHETSLREVPGDPHGARLSDNRCEGCIVEMLGRKKWAGDINADPSTLAERPPKGDVRLHHLRYLKAEPEPDEETWKLRVGKTPRRDAAECG
mmetsp:Transcript_101494/g.185897  ORF Transcript_101494/g.185897 Transcript_101494/m.185897 type:complete len:303 (-) Transcript_101494:66-974(-)